jgi:L-phenylalanine/L-methionine N-acetyltransferase
MNLVIRPIKLEDAPYINEIRRMDGVRENIMGIISERIARSEDFIKGLNENAHVLVAELTEEGNKKVVGIIGLHVSPSVRARHSASLGIMIHKDYQGKGIGRALMSSILDLADNWLMLIRVDLEVFTDNERAINLYESFGFEMEGIRKYAIIKNGKYADDYLMARYHFPKGD